MVATRGRVLLISYYFAPQNAIGAVRPTKLAKYLTRMGFEVTVLCGRGINGTEDPTLRRDALELKEIRTLSEWNPLRDYKARKRGNAGTNCARAPGSPASQAAPEARTGFAARARNALYLYLWQLSDHSFYRRAIRELKTLAADSGRAANEPLFDAVFSSYAPFSVHEAALYAKRVGLAKHWIADFRDEPSVAFRWREPYMRRLMTKVRNCADIVCTVSNGAADMLGIPARVLYNGFDREDAEVSEPAQREPDETLRLVYCGQLRSGRKGVSPRDLTPCFRALRLLIDEGKLDQHGLRLVYAGDEGGAFREFALSCGLENCVRDMGHVPRARSLALQQSADALLLASWNMRGQTGILTGKLYEYMMMGKPIVCCVNGDLPNSELKTLIADNALGFCFEKANADMPALKDYLAELIARQRNAAPVRLPGTEKFTYQTIAAKLAAWIENTEHEPKNKEEFK